MKTAASIAAVVILILFPPICFARELGQEDEGNARVPTQKPATGKEAPKIPELCKPVDVQGLHITISKAEVTLIAQGSNIEKGLVLLLRIQNTNDRRIIRYDRAILSQGLELQDDVGNLIIHSVRTQHRKTGEDEREEILPGDKSEQYEQFRVPPPKTIYLILTMDLAAFGREGKPQFKIPANKIGHITQKETNEAMNQIEPFALDKDKDKIKNFASDDEAMAVKCLPIKEWRRWTVDGQQVVAKPVKISPLYVWLQPKDGGKTVKADRSELKYRDKQEVLAQEKRAKAVESSKKKREEKRAANQAS